jgi:hypothetical protein
MKSSWWEIWYYLVVPHNNTLSMGNTLTVFTFHLLMPSTYLHPSQQSPPIINTMQQASYHQPSYPHIFVAHTNLLIFTLPNSAPHNFCTTQSPPIINTMQQASYYQPSYPHIFVAHTNLLIFTLPNSAPHNFCTTLLSRFPSFPIASNIA